VRQATQGLGHFHVDEMGRVQAQLRRQRLLANLQPLLRL
jgi:hypothetical protein